MNGFRKCVAGIAAFGILVAMTFPANANLSIRQVGATRQVNTGSQQSFGRVEVSGVPHSMFPARDFGRRQPFAPMTVSIMLRYNRQAELDALVAAQGNRRSPLYHHFLSSAQFNSYFAPTPQQQAYIVANLQAAGFHVTRTFPNRTLLDVVGTSAATERFFDTEIHSISQGRYGARFANVKPATVPANLAPLIRSVSLSNLVVVKAGPRRVSAAGLAFLRASLPRGRRAPAFTRFIMPAYAAPNISPDATNVVKDPSFESGRFGDGWSRCNGPHAYPTADITNSRAHTRKFSGFSGSLKTIEPEQNGYTGVCQLVRIPQKGTLSAYLYQRTSEKNTKVAGQDVALLDASGNVVAALESTDNNHAGWVPREWNVGEYAGRNLYIYFGVHGDGDRHSYTQQYVDDVSLTGSGATPAPTPVPSATPQPTPVPTATPQPTPVPTATPQPTPTGAVACNGESDSGPLSNENGYLATGVAEAFDYPVQYGCNGAGTTVAVVIDAGVVPSDVSAYLNAAGISATGTITDVPIDGGGSTDGLDNIETSLDVETIAGLAPATNILIYDTPDLGVSNIEDAYNGVVSDNIASVVNSSFGACEDQLATANFPYGTDAIAEQGAALGITFVASSGDFGSDECHSGNNPPGVDSPSGDPHFVSLGGDNFTESPSGTLLTLTATGDPFTNFLSGGGVSDQIPLPTYQNGITNVIATGRNQPDLSLPGLGVAVYYGNGYATTMDGTSWSSPCFVALLAEATQLGSTRFGFVNPSIYSVFTSAGYGDFTDVLVGSNGYYSAGPYYDQVTGIGAPMGYAFSQALVKVH